MTVVTLEAEGITVSVDLAVGHLARLEISRDGRTIAPLHRAPWVDDGAGLPPDLPANVARLSGDFFCAPFSANDVEGGPPHGWTANGAWRHLATERAGDATLARFVLERTVMGARVEKRLTLRDGHPFLYQEHVLTGGTGGLPVAHHTMVHMAAGARLSFSPKRCALTPGQALERDPARGRSLLAYSARSADPSAMPTAAGAGVDLKRYPIGERHEDFVTLVEAPHGGLGYALVAREAERDLVMTLRDPAALPVTMLWYSNGGRDYPPWNGRHTGVLGIEDGISAIGHRNSLDPDNAVRREGVETVLALDPSGEVRVRQIVGAVPLEGARTPIGAAAVPGILDVRFEDGETIRLPFDHGFLGFS